MRKTTNKPMSRRQYRNLIQLIVDLIMALPEAERAAAIAALKKVNR